MEWMQSYRSSSEDEEKRAKEPKFASYKPTPAANRSLQPSKIGYISKRRRRSSTQAQDTDSIGKRRKPEPNIWRWEEKDFELPLEFGIKSTLPQHKRSTLRGHTKGVNRISWGRKRSKHFLASASIDKSVLVWDPLRSVDIAQRLNDHTHVVKDCKWSMDGVGLFTGGYDGKIHYLDVETGEKKATLSCPDETRITCVCPHPSNSNIVVGGAEKGGFFSWDTRTESISKYFIDSFGEVKDLCFLNEGTAIVSSGTVLGPGNFDRGIITWDFSSGAKISNQIYKEGFTCTSLRLHPKQKTIAAQSSGNYIFLFSSCQPYRVDKRTRYASHKVAGYGIQCDFSSEGKYIASGDAEGRLCLYKTSSNRIVKSFQAHKGACIDVAYHPSLPSTIATCGWDSNIHLYH